MWPFRKRVIPAVGEKWEFKPTKDPWGNIYRPVTILDVKDGWVRYDMGTIFRDERKKISEFLSMYRKVR